MSSTYYVILEILIVSVIPIALLSTGIISPKYRLRTYAFSYSFVVPIIYTYNIDFIDMGLTYKSFAQTADIYIFQMVATVIVCFFVAYVVKYRIYTDVTRDLNPIVYILVSVVVQQFVYFAVIRYRIEMVTDNQVLIAISIALLFMASHIPWGSVALDFVTFVLALSWSIPWVITGTPSLTWTLVGHMIIGLFSLVIVEFESVELAEVEARH